jgi:hypothetical protein
MPNGGGMTTHVADAAASKEAAMSDRREARRLERTTLLSAFAPLVVDLGSSLSFYALFALTE